VADAAIAPLEPRVHPTVYLDWRVRVLGHLMVAIVLASIFYQRGESWALWAAMVAQGLLWPHLAFLHARNSRDSRRTERVNLLGDGFFIGCWIAQAQFQLWPTVMFVSALLPAFLSIGGVTLALGTSGALTAGALVMGALTGFRFNPESTPLTIALSIGGFFVYATAFGVVTHRMARRILQSNRVIAQQASEVEAQRHALAETLEEQTATADVLHAIAASAGNPWPAVDLVAGHAARLADVDHAVVFRLEGDVLRMVASRGALPEGFDVTLPLRVSRDSATGRAVIERVEVHIPDVLAAPEGEWALSRRLQRRVGFRTVLAVPLLREGVPLGVILAHRSEVRPFSAREITLLQTFAQEAAIALEHARLFEQLGERSQELVRSLEEVRALSEVNRALSASLDLEHVLATVLRHAVLLSESDAGFIVEYGPATQTFRVVASHGLSPAFGAAIEAQPVDASQGVLRRATETGEPFQIADVEAAERFFFRAITLSEGFRALLAAPMPSVDAARGGVVVVRRRAGRFDDRVVRLLMDLARQSKVAIDNARLFQETRKQRGELERLSQRMQGLYRLSSDVQEPLSLREQLHRVLEGAIALGFLDRIYVWAVSAEADRLVNLAGAGFAADEAAELEGAEIPLTEAGAMYKAYREGVPLLYNPEQPLPPELRLRPPYSELRAIRTRELLIIPMVARGITVGVLAGDNKPSKRPISVETADLLQTFSSHAAVAIANAQLFAAIEEKSRQLEIASRAKSQFLANMSHELRTPMNAILGYTELVLDDTYGTVPEKIREVLERVQKSGRHLLDLINDVLDLSRIEAGQLTLSVNEYSMADLVKSVFLTTEPLASEKGLRLDVSIPPTLPPARGDERRLTQVLLNLVGNAVKFTDGGDVRVRVGVTGDYFHVAVSDTGPGVALEDQDRIFEEFQQADGSHTRKKGGSGLGLAISRRIVELHGGRLWVESRVGEGSTFSFTVPVRLERRRKAMPVDEERRRGMA
jgi:signal transduction histidine kinase